MHIRNFDSKIMILKNIIVFKASLRHFCGVFYMVSFIFDYRYIYISNYICKMHLISG